MLVSWAVTRGPSANPRDRRLAVRTEDHPLDYASFEGTIPKGEYGGGTVILWEYASYSPINGDPGEAVRKGEIKFVAHGERMRGKWVLVRMHTKEKRENWLLIKERDEFVEEDDSLVSRFPNSVSTARTREQIEKGAPAKSVKPKKSSAPPAFVEPQLCSIAEAPPSGDEWVYELKYDGYRLELAVADGKAVVYTRSGLDWTERFSHLAADAGGLKCRSALIDGEAVVLDAKGVSQFPSLVAALEKHSNDIQFVAFDLLSLDGRDLRKKPLAERQAALRGIVGDGVTRIQVATHIEGDGQRVFEQAVAAGAEGVVAKDRTAPYVSGRTHAFVKIKGYPRTDVVIVAYKPSTKSDNFASLHAAVEEDGGLRYVGGIGTGYTEAQRAALFKKVSRGAAAKPLVPLKGEIPKGLKYLKEPLRAEIRFGGWTGEGHLRQARFLALREDLPVTISPARPKPAKAKPAGPITHAERIVYPDSGVTKGEIAAYYEAVADRIGPHLRNRPLSIVRAPETIAETFFQRHPLRGMETGVIPVEVDGETYLSLDGPLGLHTAAQFGAIELHGWMSTTEALDAPDRMVFDLDPDEGLDFAEVKRAAADIAKALREIGLESWPMISGGKGVHVVAPLDGTASYDETEPFAKGFAQALASHDPKRFVATMSKQRRKGRIFVDWLRNKKTATAILPWSLRARPGAPAAIPLTWAALAKAKAANLYNVKTALKLKDPWTEFFTTKQTLPRGR